MSMIKIRIKLKFTIALNQVVLLLSFSFKLVNAPDHAFSK